MQKRRRIHGTVAAAVFVAAGVLVAQSTPTVRVVDSFCAPAQGAPASCVPGSTAQSHSQKVVRTAFGTFMTYVKGNYYNPAPSWFVMRWDGLATNAFTTIATGQHQTGTPVLEAASDGTLYLAHGEEREADYPVYVYRLSPQSSPAFSPQLIARVPWAAAQKFSLVLDVGRGRLYYAGQAIWAPTPLVFVELTLGGSTVRAVQLTGNELAARPSYPNMLIDNGVLYLAWTTGAIGGNNSSYYSIHAARSPDGGVTWQNLAGQTLPVPFAGDTGGIATEVTQPAERPCVTWLSSFTVARGKAHFAYFVSPLSTAPQACPASLHNVQRYQRFDTASGSRDMDVVGWSPAGRPMWTFDGFFSLSPDRENVYFTGKLNTWPMRLATVGSSDRGETWSAQSETLASDPDTGNDNPYGIGGARLTTTTNQVIGSYTDQFNGNPTAVPPVFPVTTIKHYSGSVGLPYTPPTGARIQGVTVTASSAIGTSYEPWRAGDNDLATSWVSAPSSPNNTAWVLLDIGAVRYVSRLRFAALSTAPVPASVSGPGALSVEASVDGTTWRQVEHQDSLYAIYDGNVLVDGPARYLRLNATRINDNSGWVLGFREIWAEGAAYAPPGQPRLPATIITLDAYPGYPANNAVDANFSTLWAQATPSSGTNAFTGAQLTLERAHRVKRLRWQGAAGSPHPMAQSPANYRIEISSDGVNWTKHMERVGSSGVVSGDEIIDREARFVRFVVTKVHDGAPAHLSLYEIWVE